MSIPGGGGAVLVLKIFDFFKNQFSTNDNTYKLGIIIGLLVFIAIVLIFFVKPIVLCKIRWGKYQKMHEDELNSSFPPDGHTPMHNNYSNLSQTMCNELDNHFKETDDDFKKIIELSTYNNNKKKGGT